jgi:hypothetical protein
MIIQKKKKSTGPARLNQYSAAYQARRGEVPFLPPADVLPQEMFDEFQAQMLDMNPNYERQQYVSGSMYRQSELDQLREIGNEGDLARVLVERRRAAAVHKQNQQHALLTQPGAR